MSIEIQDMSVRFWAKVDRNDDCWNWQGATNSRGYGVIRAPKRGPLVFAHRYSAMLRYGMFSKRDLVLHHCDNRKCVNPDHLYIGTPQQNMDDMHRRGRWRKRGPNRNSYRKPGTPDAIRKP